MFRRGQRLRVLLRWEYAGTGKLYLTNVDMVTAFTATCPEHSLALSVGPSLHWSVVDRPEFTVAWVMPDLSVKQTRMFFDPWLRGPRFNPNEGAVFDEIVRALRAGEDVLAATLHRKMLVDFRDQQELIDVVNGAVRLTAFGTHTAWLRDHPEAQHVNPHAAS